MYENRSQETKKSAERIVELILSLYPETKSVVDVGCGTGIFYLLFKNMEWRRFLASMEIGCH
jgi:ribosomal protein L11 methylase PrmA